MPRSAPSFALRDFNYLPESIETRVGFRYHVTTAPSRLDLDPTLVRMYTGNASVETSVAVLERESCVDVFDGCVRTDFRGSRTAEKPRMSERELQSVRECAESILGTEGIFLSVTSSPRSPPRERALVCHEKCRRF